MKQFYLPLMVVGAALAQQDGPSFEVATIKPAAPNQAGYGINYGRGMVHLNNVTLRQAILYAYQLHDYQLSGGPKWAASDTYDIVGKSEQHDAGNEAVYAMLRSLLAERFQLVMRKEIKPLPAYDLVAAKGEPKLTPAATGDKTPGGWSTGASVLKASAVTMGRFADLISEKLGRRVVDKTGAAGNYNFELHFAADNAPPDSGLPSFFTALRERYGLKLQSSTAPGDTYVIDRAERPSAN